MPFPAALLIRGVRRGVFLLLEAMAPSSSLEVMERGSRTMVARIFEDVRQLGQQVICLGCISAHPSYRILPATGLPDQ